VSETLSSVCLRSRPLLLGLCLAIGACGKGQPASDEPQSAAPAAAAPDLPRFDHVVLVTFDTLRADHLTSYGYPRDTTPFLARLAAQGVLFENALASVSHTAPSHATMFTGLPPRVHGVRQNGNKLAAEVPSLPGLFAQRGFASAAFLGAQFLSGITHGFEHVSQRAPTTATLVDQATEWVKVRGGQPFFLWLHVYDPHQWKRPRIPDWARESVIASRPGDGGAFLDEIASLHGFPAHEPEDYLAWSGNNGQGTRYAALPREFVARFIDDYDGSIRFSDHEVERLYQALEQPGAGRKGLWIFTCDHGEGLGSHGYEGHGGRIYNEQLRVGLVFHATDGSLPSRRVQELAGHVDLLPTLSELFGLAWQPPNGEFFGRSLVPLLLGTAGLPERLFFAEQRRSDGEADEGDEMVAIQDRRHKLIRYPDGREEFFALERDPLELHDAGKSDARRAELRAALEERLRFFSALGAGELQAPAPEFLKELEDLGYAR